HVRIKRPLGEKLGFARALRGGLEYVDESLADDLSFPLGIGDPLQLGKKEACGVFVLKFDVEISPEYFPHRFGFTGSQQPVIDEDAGQLIADSLVDQSRGHT